LTGFYGHEPEEMKVFWSKFTGVYAPYFWTMVACNVVIPVGILSFRRTRTIRGSVIVSIAVCAGMWLERFIIVAPTLANPRLEYPHQPYIPTWVEAGETVGCFCVFIMFYLLFTKFFPIVSIWEIQEGRTKGVRETTERVESYLPELGRAGGTQ
jgi:molybdopterin-containing oxidoreductase family membrane subunit